MLAALERETERSLAAVGVSVDPLPAPTPSRKPRFARSAKWALELSLRVTLERAERRIESRHILIAVLQASRGTVPRALEVAGVDRDALRRRL